ncbi:MAG TPA: M48 family metalloprotease [Kiritimatiellia bacterium]|nr:M48 family metalloprotease [Kiritimatiellia bacterium]
MIRDTKAGRLFFSFMAVGFLAASLLSSGCASIAKVGASVGQATGVITPQQADSIVKSAEAVEKTFADITPEQEYFIGRAVGATIISEYSVFDNDEANKYINRLGKSVARFSDVPETFRGYHFLILDTDEISAFAAPGGFIFVSRGMIRLCKTEDDLAAIIAHEVGHIQHKHAIKAIKSSRLTSALTIIGLSAAKELVGPDLAKVTEAFEGSITDITKTMTQGGYARGQEREADRAAIAILKRMGYRQGALIDVLARMDEVLKTDKRGFGSTHPPASDRIKDLRALVDDTGTPVPTNVRQKRFDQLLKLI